MEYPYHRYTRVVVIRVYMVSFPKCCRRLQKPEHHVLVDGERLLAILPPGKKRKGAEKVTCKKVNANIG